MPDGRRTDPGPADGPRSSGGERLTRLRTSVLRHGSAAPDLAAGLGPVSLSALAAAAIVTGALLLTRPLTAALALFCYIAASLVAAGIRDAVRGARIAGICWAAAGVAVGIFAFTPSVTWLPLAAAAVMFLVGALTVAAIGVGDGRGATFVAVVTGATLIALSWLAVRWPDAAILVIGAGFALAAIGFGLFRASAAATAAGLTGPARPRIRIAGRILGSTTLAVVVIAGVLVTMRADSAAPVRDSFGDVRVNASTRPGELIAAETFIRGVPDDAGAWRYSYTTTRADGTPVAATGLVVAPNTPGPHPVIVWAHGTTGFDPRCAPSLLREPFTSGALFALAEIVAKGWIVVAPDYPGLGTSDPQPYLVGSDTGRAVLDAVRAARRITDAELGPQTVVWGHSQGGHAALWAGQLQPAYAPDVPLSGVAAFAPASDLPALTRRFTDVEGGDVFASYLLAAYDRAYPDVDADSYLRPIARPLQTAAAGRCLSEPAVVASLLASVAIERDVSPFWRDPASGPFAARLAENVPTGRVPAPLLLAQGATDPLVTPDVQDDYVRRRCAAGQDVDYRLYPERDHVGLMARDSPAITDALAWTVDRFASAPTRPGCPSL